MGSIVSISKHTIWLVKNKPRYCDNSDIDNRYCDINNETWSHQNVQFYSFQKFAEIVLLSVITIHK